MVTVPTPSVVVCAQTSGKGTPSTNTVITANRKILPRIPTASDGPRGPRHSKVKNSKSRGAFLPLPIAEIA